MNLYCLDGVFDYHRDRFLSLSSNCMPKLDAAKEKNRRYCHKAARRLQARLCSRCARAISSYATSPLSAAAWVYLDAV
jgi:hypothetical protein